MFSVDILTPSKVVEKDLPVDSLLIPTVKGQINVLEDHTHIVSKIQTGALTLFMTDKAQEDVKHFSMTTGICKVLNKKIIILTNTCEEHHEIDAGRAEATLKFAEEKLEKESLSEDEFIKYTRKVERAKLRLQLAKFQG